MKGGEDVRTDERMEMILDVCNGLLARHPGAASHRLKAGRCWSLHSKRKRRTAFRDFDFWTMSVRMCIASDTNLSTLALSLG